MKVVKVYGALRKRLGQCRFEFDVATPAQAIKALCVNFPGLDKWLVDSEKNGVGYRVAVSKEKVTEENVAPLLMPFSDKEVFSITPVIAGAGGNTGTLIFGIALTALAFASGAGLFGAAFAKNLGLIATAKTIGIGLSLQGVAQIISPQPQLSGLEDGPDAARLESFSISNVVNTSRQGLPVPIAYGRVFVGSAVLSSGLDVDQVQV